MERVPIRVLIVEDDDDFAYLIQDQLTRQGDMEVVGRARDRRGALALAQSLEPRVVLMDLSLSAAQMDGVEAARDIRIATGAKVVILTVYEDPKVVLFALPPTQASEANRVQQHACAYYQLPVTTDPAVLSEATLIVDALLGIGIDRPVEGHYADLIDAMNQAEAPIVAIDLPSGMNTDTGEAMGTAVTAASTVTLAYLKVGLTTPAGEAQAGHIIVADHIGIYDL